MGRKAIKDSTLRFLYGKSGNKCAYPDCTAPIFEGDGTLTGECCHIEAYSPNGARYNTSTSSEEKNAEENLILMCSRHHKIIDTHPEQYSVETLKKYKQQHEMKYSHEQRELDQNMLKALEYSIITYWDRIQNIDTADTTGLKITLDPNFNVEEFTFLLDENFKKLEEFMESFHESDQILIEDLQYICEQVGLDYTQFETLPYYNHLFVNRNWVEHSIGIPNVINHLKMYYFALNIKYLEELVKHDQSYMDKLLSFREKLLEFQKGNYYAD